MLLWAAVYENALEAWVREHSPVLIWLALTLSALLVVRLVVKRLTRRMAVALLGLLALIVFNERAAIRDCSRSCECNVTAGHVDVPFCRPSFEA